MERYEQRICKLSYRSQDDLVCQINQLGAYRVLSVDYETIPESGDGRSWAEIHYLVRKNDKRDPYNRVSKSCVNCS